MIIPNQSKYLILQIDSNFIHLPTEKKANSSNNTFQNKPFKRKIRCALKRAGKILIILFIPIGNLPCKKP